MRQVLLLFCIVLLPLSLPAQTPTIEISFPLTELAQHLSCHEDLDRVLTLQWSDRIFLISLPELVATPLIRGRATCQAFLADLQKSGRKLQRLILPLELLPPDPAREGPPHYRITSAAFYRSCRKLGYCAQHPFDFFTVKPEIKACQPSFSWAAWWERMRPRLLRPRYEQIERVKIRAFPFQPLTEDLRAAGGQAGRSAILAATMSIGTSAIYDLAQALQDGQRPVFLALDAGTLFAAGDAALLPNYFLKHPVLHAIPMTSGFKYQSIFHWKIIADHQASGALLSSMNLSNPLKTPFVDFSYELGDPGPAHELKGLLYTAMTEQCQRLSDFNCLAAFSTADAALRRKLSSTAERGCQALSELAAPLLQQRSPRFFMQPQNTDIENLFIELIEGAQQELVLLTHKFTLPRVAQALTRAQGRGVKVYVLSTRPPQYSAKAASFFYHNGQLAPESWLPEPHMKVMVIDRQRLFFGTGNFTQNAFKLAAELYALSEDPEAISFSLRLAASLLLGFQGGGAPDFGLPAASEQWLVLAPLTAPAEAWPETLPPESPWMPYYRRITPAGRRTLKACRLGHALLLPRKLYADCLSSSLEPGE